MFVYNLRLLLKKPEMAIFIDETHKDRSAARRNRGWSLKGIEIDYSESFNWDIRYTLIGAADCYGFVPEICEAIPHDVNGKIEEEPVNAERFYQYFLTHIYPFLGSAANMEKHSVVIMDNCTVYNDPRIAILASQKGAPDLIPIEWMFKQYKDYLNRYSREFKKHWDLVHEDALRSISPAEGLRYFRRTTLCELVDDHELMPEDDEDTVIAVAVVAFLIIEDLI